MWRRALTGWILLGACAFAQAPAPLNLPGALDLLLANNRELARLALSLEAALLNISDAQANLSWTLRPAGLADATDQGQQYGAGLKALKKFAPGTQLEIGGELDSRLNKESDDYYRGTLRVGVSQPLLRNAGAVVTLDPLLTAQSAWLSARRTLELKKMDLIVEAVRLYEEIQRLERQIASDEQALQRLHKLLRLAQAKEKQGRATRVDALRVDLQVGRAQTRLQDNTARLEASRQEFADLLGQDPTAVYALAPTPDVRLELVPREASMQTALSNRLDYAQALQNLRDAQRGVDVAQRNFLPALRLVSRYERYGQGTEPSDASMFDEDGWFIGLEAGNDWPMRKEHNAYERSRISEQQAAESLLDAENMVRKQTLQQWVAYERALQDRSLAERNRQLASNRVRLARRMFEIGKGDTFTVSDAEDELLQADNAFLAAQAEASVAVYRVKRVLGTLLEVPAELLPGGMGESKK